MNLLDDLNKIHAQGMNVMPQVLLHIDEEIEKLNKEMLALKAQRHLYFILKMIDDIKDSVNSPEIKSNEITHLSFELSYILNSETNYSLLRMNALDKENTKKVLSDEHNIQKYAMTRLDAQFMNIQEKEKITLPINEELSEKLLSLLLNKDLKQTYDTIMHHIVLTEALPEKTEIKRLKI